MTFPAGYIPTAQDWITDPESSSAAHEALVATLNEATAAANPETIGEGIGAAVLANPAAQALAATAANEVAPGSGLIVQAGMAVASSALANQHAQALASLTPEDQALLTTTVTAAATAIAAKNTAGVVAAVAPVVAALCPTAQAAAQNPAIQPTTGGKP